jgi:hypothetical protein
MLILKSSLALYYYRGLRFEGPVLLYSICVNYQLAALEPKAARMGTVQGGP